MRRRGRRLSELGLDISPPWRDPPEYSQEKADNESLAEEAWECWLEERAKEDEIVTPSEDTD